jgi:hypothetical protein
MTTEETVLFKNLRIGEKFIFPDKPKYYNMRTNNGANSYIHLNGLNRGCSYNPFSINSPVIIIDEVTENIKPKEKTLKERIEEEFPGKVVVDLIENWGTDFLTFSHAGVMRPHAIAQSVLGFYAYVYDTPDGFKINLTPVNYSSISPPTIQHPVAVLFERGDDN